MKFLVAMMTIALLGDAVVVGAAEPVRINLDGDWEFTYTGSSTADIPEPPPTSAYDGKIAVPGRWDDQLGRLKNCHWWPQAVFRAALGPVQYLSGTGWHRRVIDVPEDWAHRCVTLTIGNAVGTTHVWLNGRHVGENRLGVYTPFEVDLTADLRPGRQNELVIAVDNAARNIFGGWTFLGNAGMASGLARPVTLDVSAGPGRIADVHVRPGEDLRQVIWQTRLAALATDKKMAPSKLQWSVRDPISGRELGSGEVDVPSFSRSREIEWSSRIDDIKPWSDREPNLYFTTIRWTAPDGEDLDVREQRFGLRRWSYAGRKLFLNGKPHYLRLEFGAYYFPLDGAVSMSKDYWLRHMKRLKELGLNGINFAAQVCPIEMMEAADELGVILQCGDHVTTRKEGIPHYREVWESIVRTTRRHPSISIYGFGGELKYYDGVIEQNKAQMDLIKSLHPESLVMPQQAIHGIDYGIEDPSDAGVKRRPFLHHAERLARYTNACDLFGHYSGGAFSHGYFGTPWRIMESRFEIYEKPLVAHELFISASYLRPENIVKYTGRIPPYIYTRLKHDLKEAGLIDKWETYFDHTSRLQHICRKYCMEKVRKCNGLAGFELLGMMDMHFITPEYAVGIVDEFLQMKPGDSLAGIRKYSDESVLLLDFDSGYGLNRCYWEGELFEAEIMASLYGPENLKTGTLTWRLKNDDQTLLEGSDELVDVANGRVSSLKKLEIIWPQMKRTTRVNLSVELRGSGYSLSNDWDFWVFPRQAAPSVVAAADEKSLKLLGRYDGVTPLTTGSAEKLRIVSKLSTADIEHLNRGGTVVLLGSEPFTAYTQWPSFYPAKGYRPFSNGGTILAQHPIFAGHPHDGWNDWHFYPLMQGANSVLFDDAIGMTFDPIMEIISSAGHVRKQALIFEQRVGDGRLLVTPLVFDMTNPSCVTLMDSLLRYVQSDEFRPRHAIDVEELIRAASPPDAAGNSLVDPSFEKSGHWVSEGGKYEFDHSIAHHGRKSLKLSVTEADLRESRNFSSGVSTRQITFRGSPRRLKLAAWFKTDIRGGSGGPRVRATFRYEDAHIRSSSFSIAMPEKAGDWRYVEKIIDLDGKLTVANVYVDLTGVAGTAWIDNMFFGAVPVESDRSANPGNGQSEHPVAASWQNQRVTRRFDSPVWFRVDQSEWKRGSEVVVDSEGAHTLSVKEAKDEPEPKVENIFVDLTPPVVTLEIDPLPEQEAGLFSSKADTRYSIRAVDGLSGVKSIEIAIDGKNYAPYTKPFSLPAGRHSLRCRATDQAGNISKGMTGEWITGSDEEFLEIDVRPVEN